MNYNLIHRLMCMAHRGIEPQPRRSKLRMLTLHQRAKYYINYIWQKNAKTNKYRS